jgi:hypothetical protein
MFADTEHRNDTTVTRRFSEGIEQLPETPEKNATRRFSPPADGHPAPARHSRQARQAAV